MANCYKNEDHEEHHSEGCPIKGILILTHKNTYSIQNLHAWAHTTIHSLSNKPEFYLMEFFSL